MTPRGAKHTRAPAYLVHIRDVGVVWKARRPDGTTVRNQHGDDIIYPTREAAKAAAKIAPTD